MPAVPTTTAPVIRVRDLRKRFGSVTALDGVSLEIAAPATGLLGANGAGKSTLIKSVLGLLAPDTGTIEVLGLGSAGRAAELRRRIGYMPEHDCLPGTWSARDFIVHLAELRGLPRRAAAVRASEVLFQVGLEEERSRAIGTFSLGMKQRTKLAQAIVHSPELVLLDEPTAGLDPAGRVEMLALLRRLSTELGIRVVISSHMLEDVRRTCDQVLVLSAGRLTASRRVASEETDDDDDLVVRIGGDVDGFLRILAGRGLQAVRDGEDHGLVSVTGASRDKLDAIRDAAADTGVGLRELRPAAKTLEDVVLEAME
jgi:ABC-2 type transport system ATP-binding protein